MATTSRQSTNTPSLTDEQKRAVDATELIRASYYKCFSDRRDFEWKMSMSIWTSMAVFISALVIGKDPLAVSPRALIWGTIVASSLLSLIHALWLVGTARANDLDKAQAFQAADWIRAYVGLNWTEKVQQAIDGVRAQTSTTVRWSQLTQLLVTILLGLIAIAAACAR